MEKDPKVAKIDSELIDGNSDLSETDDVMDENPRVAKADAEVQKLMDAFELELVNGDVPF